MLVERKLLSEDEANFFGVLLNDLILLFRCFNSCREIACVKIEVAIKKVYVVAYNSGAEMFRKKCRYKNPTLFLGFGGSGN